MRFLGSSRRIGPALLLDRYGWNVEIAGSVPDDVSTWNISQEVTIYDDNGSKSGSHQRMVKSDSENISAPGYFLAYQPRGGHHLFVLDSPGIIPQYVSAHRVMNFTTILSKGGSRISREWAVSFTVRNGRLREASFYPHHIALR